MNLTEISNLLEAQVYYGEDKMMSTDISFVCAGDLMSDILVFSKPNAILVTGLVNLQVIRTAEMLDIEGVVLIRGKNPTEEMIELAKSKNIPLLTTPKTLYLTCGLLYEGGLKNAPLRTVGT